jgi:hypothetical protein
VPAEQYYAEMESLIWGTSTSQSPLTSHNILCESEQKEQYSDALFVNLHLQVRSQNAALAQQRMLHMEKDWFQKLENELKAADSMLPHGTGSLHASARCQADGD